MENMKKYQYYIFSKNIFANLLYVAKYDFNLTYKSNMVL